jgi:nicotinamide riboside kinase
MTTTRLICILGAESTGKTTLAQALASHYACPWVPECLRLFCQEQGRTPRREEQAPLMAQQCQAEHLAQTRAGQLGAPFVFCDTAPLLTAIYSNYVFSDTSLLPQGRALHASYALTLLLAPDIDWVADGLQRDGEHVRAPVHSFIEQELAALVLPFARISGRGPQRLAAALAAVQQLRSGQPASAASL